MSRWILRVVLCAAVSCSLIGCEAVEKERKELDLTPAKSGERQTTVGHVLDRADKSECEQYIGQLHQAAQMYKINSESYPPDLETVIKESGLPTSVFENCKLSYDPATGRVTLQK